MYCSKANHIAIDKNNVKIMRVNLQNHVYIYIYIYLYHFNIHVDIYIKMTANIKTKILLIYIYIYIYTYVCLKNGISNLYNFQINMSQQFYISTKHY